MWLCSSAQCAVCDLWFITCGSVFRVNYKVLCFSLMAARSSIFVGFPYVEFELQCVRLIRANLPGALGLAELPRTGWTPVWHLLLGCVSSPIVAKNIVTNKLWFVALCSATSGTCSCGWNNARSMCWRGAFAANSRDIKLKNLIQSLRALRRARIVWLVG